MMEKLTYQQARVLETIRQHIRETGYPPSVRELGKRLGLKSTATVHSHLRTLERKGYLLRAAQKSRAYTIVGDDVREQPAPVVMVPVVGMVRAGTPILAVENIEDFVPLPRSFVRSENVFMLQVEGDSMIGAGIHDGDLVLVRQQETAENGDIVVALIDDEATVKTFYKEKGAIRLQPENPEMSPIIAKDVRILGKVIGLCRSLH
ncbi:MAG: transcriptional repressor LexA [Bacillota bacterium]